jgi:hypothetical protein
VFDVFNPDGKNLERGLKYPRNMGLCPWEREKSLSFFHSIFFFEVKVLVKFNRKGI